MKMRKNWKFLLINSWWEIWSQKQMDFLTVESSEFFNVRCASLISRKRT